MSHSNQASDFRKFKFHSLESRCHLWHVHLYCYLIDLHNKSRETADQAKHRAARRRHNYKTMQLKHLIRDYCGQKGREWEYNINKRTEERKTGKRAPYRSGHN